MESHAQRVLLLRLRVPALEALLLLHLLLRAAAADLDLRRLGALLRHPARQPRQLPFGEGLLHRDGRMVKDCCTVPQMPHLGVEALSHFFAELAEMEFCDGSLA